MIKQVSNKFQTNIGTHSNVAVLLCTYQGERFLEQQVQSIFLQEYNNLSIWVSDDGSTDGTLAILQSLQSANKHKDFQILNGPQKGYAINFLSLLMNDEINANYFAFADQDDIWNTDKLTRAITWLQTIPEERPAIYCSRTQLIDEKDAPLGFSPLFTKKPSFSNALIQSIGGGNTMIMNKLAQMLLKKASKNQKVISHDWWAYMLITGAGGTVFYDSYPSVLYRQHDVNLVGSNQSWLAKIARLKYLLNGRFQEWNTVNIKALQNSKHLLTKENQKILTDFNKARNSWLIPRLWRFWKSGIYRQTFSGNIALLVGAILNKL